MKEYKILAKLIIVFLALSFQAKTQTWQNITYSNNGLPSNNIRSIAPDKQGNIWISTSDSGITKLKSGQFRTWKDRDRLYNGCTNEGIIINSGISRMIKDSLNNLYFTSFKYNYFGLVKFDSAFHFIKSPYDFNIYPLAIDKMGNIWCRTDNSDTTFYTNGVVKLSPNGVWQNYKTYNSGLFKNKVNDIAVDAFGNVWLGYAGSGNLSRFNGSTWKLYNIYNNSSTLSINQLKSDKTGDVYGYFDIELIQYKRNLDSVVRRTDDPAVGSNPIGVDINNKLWTSNSSGSNLLLYKNNTTTNWTTYNLPNSNFEATSLYFDDKNTTWITGGGNFMSYPGLVRYNGTIFNKYTEQNSGLLSDITNDVTKGRVLNQLIVAHPNGISMLDTITRTSRVYDENNSGLYNDFVDFIFIDSKNNKWIPRENGIQKLFPNNIDWVFYSIDSLKHVDQYNKSICEDKFGNIWFSDVRGLSEIKNNTIINFENIQISSKSATIKKIVADKLGNILLSYSDNDVIKFNGTSGIVISNNNNSNNSFSDIITTDSLGNIWTIYFNFQNFGLLKYNGTNWNIFKSPITSTITPKGIYCDSYNRIWLNSALSGVWCFDGQIWKTYNVSNSNILSDNVTSVFVDSLGKVWFGTDKGISILTPGPVSIPTLTTNEITNITSTTATSGGYITDNGGSFITSQGVCWSTSSNPTITNSKTIDVIGNGLFTSNITSLIPQTLYYVRAYATNGLGTSYGNQVSFTPGSNSIAQKLKEDKYYSLYPNPSNGKMFLKVDFNKNDLIEINAINILGDCNKIKYNIVENGLLELNIPENIIGIITLEIKINKICSYEKISIIK
jgi:streptogramin lyase